MLIQDVAEALDIHPFMLSRWRKEVRESKIVAKKIKLDERVAAGPSTQAKANARLYAWIETLHQASRGTYGSPRIHAALKTKTVTHFCSG